MELREKLHELASAVSEGGDTLTTDDTALLRSAADRLDYLTTRVADLEYELARATGKPETRRNGW